MPGGCCSAGIGRQTPRTLMQAPQARDSSWTVCPGTAFCAAALPRLPATELQQTDLAVHPNSCQPAILHAASSGRGSAGGRTRFQTHSSERPAASRRSSSGMGTSSYASMDSSGAGTLSRSMGLRCGRPLEEPKQGGGPLDSSSFAAGGATGAGAAASGSCVSGCACGSVGCGGQRLRVRAALYRMTSLSI